MSLSNRVNQCCHNKNDIGARPAGQAHTHRWIRNRDFVPSPLSLSCWHEVEVYWIPEKCVIYMVGTFCPLRRFLLLLFVIFFPNLNFLSPQSESKDTRSKGMGYYKGCDPGSQKCNCNRHTWQKPLHWFLVLHNENCCKTGQIEAPQTAPQVNENKNTFCNAS